MKKYFGIALAASLLSFNIAFADSNYNYENPNATQTYTGTPLRGHLVSVPAGAAVNATTTYDLNSSTVTQGQLVQLVLGSNFYYNNQLIAPAGSTVLGTVTDVKAARRGSLNGRLKVTFTQITTPQGIQIPINGVIRTDDGTGVLVGGTKFDVTKEYAKDMAVGSASGALSGVVFGALAGGNVGQGAALGTAVGAGGGLAKSIWDKGNDVHIPANSVINIILTQPITVNSQAYSYEE